MKRAVIAALLFALIASVGYIAYAEVNNDGVKVPASTTPPVTVQVRGNQIWVPVGESVYVYVDVYSATGAKGTLSVQVRKDLIAASDVEYTTLDAYVDLKPGETKTVYMGGFVATDVTCDGWFCAPGSFREYFIKVYFNGACIHDPTNPDGREWVKTYQL
ncbi:MAG: hypothetical protein ACXQS2_02185 [Methermicoccaceae archaeon]